MTAAEAGGAPVRRPRGKIPGKTPDPPAPTFPAPDHLDSETAKVWAELVAAHDNPAKIVGPDLETYCGQVALWRDCTARVAREGTIIENERGRPEPHPAIELARKAQAEIRAWGDKFRGRVPRPAGQQRTGAR